MSTPHPCLILCAQNWCFSRFISIMRYRDIDCGYVDLAMSCHPEIVRYRVSTCALLAGTARTQTMRTGDNYLRDCHLKGPDIQLVSDRALRRLDLYFVHSTSFLFKPTTTTSRRRQQWGRGSWVAVMPFPGPRPATCPVSRGVLM